MMDIQTTKVTSSSELEQLSWFSKDEDEEIVLFENPSVIPYLGELVAAILLIIGSFIAGIVGYFKIGTIALLLLLGVPIGILEFVKVYLQIINVFYIITNQRIMYKSGIIRNDTNKATNFDQLQNISVEITAREKIVAWILNKISSSLEKYGDVYISTAGQSGDNMKFDGVKRPHRFQDKADDYC